MTLIKTACDYCSRSFIEAELVREPGGVVCCGMCKIKRQHAMYAYLREPRCPECAMCRTPTRDVYGTPLLPLAIVWMDGIIIGVCHKCRDQYRAKRKDLYHGRIGKR